MSENVGALVGGSVIMSPGVLGDVGEMVGVEEGSFVGEDDGCKVVG